MLGWISYAKGRKEGGPRFWCERSGEKIVPVSAAYRTAPRRGNGANRIGEATRAIASGPVVTTEPGKYGHLPLDWNASPDVAPEVDAKAQRRFPARRQQAGRFESGSEANAGLIASRPNSAINKTARKRRTLAYGTPKQDFW